MYVRATLAKRFAGLGGLTFRLDRRSRRRILWASILPGFVVFSHLTGVGLAFAFGTQFVPVNPDMPEAWRRLGLVSLIGQSATVPLALAALFAAGIRPWPRPAGSWTLAIGLSLAAVALALLLVDVTIYASTSNPFEATDWKAGTWSRMASAFGLLAVGYLFVAYRAGALDLRRSRVRRPQRGWSRA